MPEPVLEQSGYLLGVSQSAKGYGWRLREACERTSLTIAQRFDLPEILARVVCGRGIGTDEAEDFLKPTLKQLLPDPFHLKDMQIAAERLSQAVVQGETVAIFGDYDVDGATSTALLVRYLQALGVKTLTHIPDRIKEGYGPNETALLQLKDKGASLVITVDCGAASHAPLQAAYDAGLDVVVMDHHIGDAALPKAVAVVNPNRLDETSAHRHLAAVGVVFLLVVATNKTLRDSGYDNLPNPLQWLDLVALGTVCDVVALKGVNRAFVAQGLKVLAKRENIGLAALADVAGMDEMPAAYHLGFLLGPRINAGGRVGKAGLGAELLACDDEARALDIARQLNHYNAERKTLESLALEEATAQAETMAADEAVLVVEGGWHPGVIGIVAGRLKEQFHKPVAVISFDGDVGKASARSVPGVDFGAAVVAARTEAILDAGGGHAMAAGFTVQRANLPKLKTFLHARLAAGVQQYEETRGLVLDGVLSAQAATAELLHQLKQLEPCGMGNAGARFAFANLCPVKLDVVGQDHLRCIFVDGGVGGRAAGGRLQSICFRAVGTPMESILMQAFQTRGNVHVAGQLKLNSWQGSERVDLHIEDVALAAKPV